MTWSVTLSESNSTCYKKTGRAFLQLHAPVQPSLALHQLFGDEFAAQGGGVGMVALDNLVDLRLPVSHPRLKLVCKPAQNDGPFLATGGNLFEARPLEEIVQHLALPGIDLHIMDEGSHLLGREQTLTAGT